MKYTVGIIGLGNIGMMYDFSSEKEVFLTHFKSFNAHDDFEIILCVDRSEIQLEKAKRKLTGKGIEYVTNWKSIKEIPDVIVLASSPKVNQEVFEGLHFNRRIKAFLVEKPFWSNSWKIENFNEVKDKVVVNYIRKFIPEVQNIKSDIVANKFGEPIKAHAWYSKGLNNNGSHLLDLMCFLLGSTDVDPSGIINLDEVDDYLPEDKSLGFKLNLLTDKSKVEVVFQPVNEKLYSVIELDLFFTKGRIRFHDFGFEVDLFEVEQDQIFKGYSNLNYKNSISINKEGYMINVLNQLVDIINGDEIALFGLEQENKISNLLNLIKSNSNDEIK